MKTYFLPALAMGLIVLSACGKSNSGSESSPSSTDTPTAIPAEAEKAQQEGVQAASEAQQNSQVIMENLRNETAAGQPSKPDVLLVPGDLKELDAQIRSGSGS